MEGTTEVRDVMLEKADDLCQAKSWQAESSQGAPSRPRWLATLNKSPGPTHVSFKGARVRHTSADSSHIDTWVK